MSKEGQDKKREEFKPFLEERKAIANLTQQIKDNQLVAQHFSAKAFAFEQKMRLWKSEAKFNRKLFWRKLFGKNL